MAPLSDVYSRPPTVPGSLKLWTAPEDLSAIKVIIINIREDRKTGNSTAYLQEEMTKMPLIFDSLKNNAMAENATQ